MGLLRCVLRTLFVVAGGVTLGALMWGVCGAFVLAQDSAPRASADPSTRSNATALTTVTAQTLARYDLATRGLHVTNVPGLCLYQTSTGSVWGTPKTALGLSLNAPCPGE